MQDAIAGFVTAPLWAQIAMVVFALMVAIGLVDTFVRKLKFRRQFDAIARELGQEPPARRGWPVTCPISIDGRAFEIRHDRHFYRSGDSDRRPIGNLLTTATRLAGTRWPMHQVDITVLKGLLSRLVRGKRPTGDPDPEFDARFLVVEDGVPVRDGWLDAATRKEIACFFDGSLPGVIWVRDGELLYIMREPWTGIDGPVIRAQLQRQAVLASALESTGCMRS